MHHVQVYPSPNELHEGVHVLRTEATAPGRMQGAHQRPASHLERRMTSVEPCQTNVARRSHVPIAWPVGRNEKWGFHVLSIKCCVWDRGHSTKILDLDLTCMNVTMAAGCRAVCRYITTTVGGYCRCPPTMELLYTNIARGTRCGFTPAPYCWILQRVQGTPL